MNKANILIAALALLFLAVLGGLLLRQQASAPDGSSGPRRNPTDDVASADENGSLAKIEQRRPTIPDEQNGALVVQRLAADLDRLRQAEAKGVLFFDDDFENPDIYSIVNQVSLEPSRALLQSHAGLRDKLRELKDSRGGRLPMSYDVGDGNPLDIMLPSLMPWRHAARFLQLEALVAAHDGETDRAVEAIQLHAKLAATLELEPNLVSRLVQTRIDNEMVDAVEGVLRLQTLSPPDVRKLEQVVERRLQQESLKACFQLERAVFQAICNGLSEGRFDWSDFTMADESSLNVKDVRTNQENGIRLYDELVREADDSLSILRVTRRQEREIQQMAGDFSKRLGSHRIVLTLMPSFSRAVELDLICIARLRCAQVGLTAEKFRGDTGELPEDAHALVPGYLSSVPVDPFSGDPVQLLKTDAGLVVYSIGDNQVDDGGDVVPSQDSRYGPDVGFRLARERN